MRPLLVSMLVATASAAVGEPSVPWVADLGDGAYRNPVLHADYSDPDVIRVGEEFYLTSSSFNSSPGLPILRSRDLVNWTLINHALPVQVPAHHFARPRHGQGVWAPAIRHHAGKFWIFYPDPDFGLYVVTAVDPAGEWSSPHLLKAGRGLIDPCPFWDADGSLWLVHGWAKSRAGINNRITLHRLSADAREVLDAGRVIIDADLLPGVQTLEGPKLYSRGGYYYIFAPANGVATGEQFVFRSRALAGPYKHRVVLARGGTPINGPHQGAWVDTPSGEDWFLHFQDAGVHGRVLHLQPMRWHEDGWPRLGTAALADDAGASGVASPVVGQPVLVHPKPAVFPSAPFAAPPTADAFAGPRLSLAWQWQANPSAGWASLSARPGRLRLAAVPAPLAGGLYDAPNLLLQKFPAPAFDATVDLDCDALGEGESAGLIIFGFSYAWIGARRSGGDLRLVRLVHADANQPGSSAREVAGPVLTDSASVRLRIRVTAGAVCCFEYRLDEAGDDSAFTPLGEPFVATSGRWVGAKVGLFASAVPRGVPPVTLGHADFAGFAITPPGAATPP